MKLEEMKTSCDINAERHLVSQLIINNDVIYELTDIQLKPQDFYDKECKKIFSAIYSIIWQWKIADIVTIANKVWDLDDEIITLALTTTWAKDYAEIIKTCSIKREISNKASNLSSVAKEQSTTLDELKKRADEMLSVCMLQEYQKEFQEELEDFYLELLEPPKSKIKTGFSLIDDKLSLRKGQLVTIAGRPWMWKSAVMSCLALNMWNCAFFSLEMWKREIAYRMASSLSGVNYSIIDNWLLNQPENIQGQIQEAFGDIKEKGLAVYDRKISFLDIKMEIKKLKLTKWIDVVFLDYLQLIRPEDPKDPRAMQIWQMTRDLKSIAKECDILVVQGSQLNRQISNRVDKTPQLSDLRESWDIEQDSDIVVFVNRDLDENADKNNIELIVAKYRNWTIWQIPMFFDWPTMSIKNKVSEWVNTDEDSIF